MSSNLDNIWTEVLNLIKVELTEVSFNTWLKTVEPVNISDTKVILAAPNEFTKNILEGRYLNLIKNAFKQVTEQDFEIYFTMPGEEDFNVNTQEAKVEEFDNNNQKAILNPKYTFDSFEIGRASCRERV